MSTAERSLHRRGIAPSAVGTGNGDEEFYLDGGDISSERDLLSVALRLGARQVRGWSQAEERLASSLPAATRRTVEDCRARIAAGEDPLGDIFCLLRSPLQRRAQGATYTPPEIVRAMLEWAAKHGTPARVVDPGVGSGRFLIDAARRLPAAKLVGVEIDPVAAILARAHLAAVGVADRSEVMLCDFRSAAIPRIDGRTLYIGNPPYVRHHDIDAHWKRWLSIEAARLMVPVSQLAGLHAHFLLATAIKGLPGDYGAFITAAEWLDVNYGKLVRALFLGRLGGLRIDLIEPTALPFKDAATTAAITAFEIGADARTVRFRRIQTLQDLNRFDGGRDVPRAQVAASPRWTHLSRPPRKTPSGFIELGEICRVHRGQVTGANDIWIAGARGFDLPASVLYRTVTRARELFDAAPILRDASGLKQVIDLPVELDGFDAMQRMAIDRFLDEARRCGADRNYIATHRKAWWSVGLRRPAPILATYMARRPPAFVLNRGAARHINIAHGIYPRERLSDAVLMALVEFLSKSAQQSDGRTYAGGLTKFEPREMERMLIPRPEVLVTGAA
jgi:adenine-specific DNA-methyltransferase